MSIVNAVAPELLWGRVEHEGFWGFLMLRLVLFRHGQAVPHNQGPDISRSLTETGRRQSVEIAKALHEGGIDPELVLISPAIRTRETWDSAKQFFPASTTRIERDLYLATPDLILSLIHAIADRPKTVMIVGHNPAFHDISLDLFGFGDRYAFARLRDDFPTSGCAVFDFDVAAWSDLAANQGRLDRFLIPLEE